MPAYTCMGGKGPLSLGSFPMSIFQHLINRAFVPVCNLALAFPSFEQFCSFHYSCPILFKPDPDLMTH